MDPPPPPQPSNQGAEVNDKENEDDTAFEQPTNPASKIGKQPQKPSNRRDSLARGILKLQGKDDATLHGRTIHAVPLRGDTTAMNEIKKAYYKRRVSFAPEVTMHKIDLIPVGNSLYKEDGQQPKRRETIAVVPSSASAENSLEVQGPIQRPDPVIEAPQVDLFEDDDAREMLVDSSDAEEMDDDDDDHSVGSLEQGQINNGQDEDGTDKSIDMALTMIQPHQLQGLKAQQEMDDNTEQTMDLTQPLTLLNQQLSQAKLNVYNPDKDSQEEEQEEEKLSQSNRPFGSITALFDPDESGNQSLIEAVDDAEESIDEGEDMELTGKFDVRKLNKKAEEGKEVQEEEDNEEEMELTGKFQVALNRRISAIGADDADDADMDLTTVHNLNISTNEDATMDFTLIFRNNTSLNQNQEEEENTMELTQTNPMTTNVSEVDMDLTNIQRANETTEEMTMDLTNRFGPLDERRRIQDPIFDDDDAKEDDDGEASMNMMETSTTENQEQSMELTDLNVSTNGEEDELTIMNTKLNRNIANYVSSQDILVTSTQNEHPQSPPPPQQLTSPQAKRSSVDNNKPESVSPVPALAVELLTPIKPKRSHTTETGSPMSSKRRYSANEDILQQVRTKLNSMTPKRVRREPSDSRLSTGIAAVEPTLEAETTITRRYQPAAEILTTQPFVLEDEVNPPPAFTPLKEANKRKSLTQQDKVPFELPNITSTTTTTTVPLAEAHDLPEQVDAEDYVPVTIQQFFKDLSIEFFGTLDVLDQYERAFNQVKYPELTSLHSVTDLDYSIARSSNVPWLALAHFSCSEMLKNLKELKEFFDKLEGEFFIENPNFVKEYYLSQSLNLQKSLSDHFVLMKEYSDEIAENKLWVWRDMLYDELLVGLESSTTRLNEEIEQANKIKDELQDIELEVVQELKASDEEMNILREKLKDLELSRSEDLQTARTELSEELDLLTVEEEQLKSLEAELVALNDQIIDNSKLKDDIKEKEKYIKENKIDFQQKLRQDTEEFELKLNASGLKFIKITDSVIHYLLKNSKIKIKYDILDESQREIIIPNSIIGLTRQIINDYIAKNQQTPIDKITQTLIKLHIILTNFEKDVFFLGTKYPIKSQITKDQTLKLELLNYNRKSSSKMKVFFDFNLQSLMESSNSKGLKPDTIKCKIIYGLDKNKEELVLKKFLNENKEFGFIN